ncbi:electron transfer flavoprotein alpha subunit [Rhodotorula toruloides]|uniref:Probable electron transfer flavoprotein subunit alpha n=1 Tax=Rhodotorula toruloides TaxID=5286 RepID=A0A511KLJ5_RHOTO|nr:electron transfer flavoprotein alpha subunit [Rhodotorula toruloides]
MFSFATRTALPRASTRSFSASGRANAETLVFLETKGDSLVPSAANAITAAKKVGGKVTGLIIGKDEASVKPAVERAKKMGLDALLVRTSPALEHALAEPTAPVFAELVKKGGYTHFAAGHSALGKNLFPRVAGLLEVQQISDVMSIQDENTFTRPVYAGNAIATVKSTDSIKLFTVRASTWEPAQEGDKEAEVEVKEAENVGPAQAEWVSEELVKSERPDLATAPTVVSGGRGVKSKEAFDETIIPLADAFGAAIGASRAAVDSGYADNSLQVGQTGKVIAPNLYVAVGISGAIQHLAGMKDSKTIVAINKDADAPIFQVADIGLVADLFEAVPELTKKVQEAKK